MIKEINFCFGLFVFALQNACEISVIRLFIKVLRTIDLQIFYKIYIQFSLKKRFFFETNKNS